MAADIAHVGFRYSKSEGIIGVRVRTLCFAPNRNSDKPGISQDTHHFTENWVKMWVSRLVSRLVLDVCDFSAVTQVLCLALPRTCVRGSQSTRLVQRPSPAQGVVAPSGGGSGHTYVGSMAQR